MAEAHNKFSSARPQPARPWIPNIEHFLEPHQSKDFYFQDAPPSSRKFRNPLQHLICYKVLFLINQLL
jgi:hypothetical protein